VLYHTQPGDIVVVDARGDTASGIFGEMMRAARRHHHRR